MLTTPEIADRPDEYGLNATRPVAVARVPTELADQFTDPGHGTDSAAFFQYTSGSTGEPKGVQVSHRNALANLVDIGTMLPPPDGERLRTVSWLPIFHDMGLAQVLVLGFPWWPDRPYLADVFLAPAGAVAGDDHAI